MKVYVLPADAYGCGHYRLIWPSDVLRKAGHSVEIIPPDARSGFFAKITDLPDGTQQLVSLRIPEDADVIVLQRPARELQIQLVQMLRANGVAVVVDMDDDMSALHPENIAFKMYSTRTNSGMSWRTAELVCKEATLVTTSTKSLQRVYAKHGRGVVIDNYVPAAYLGFTHYDTGNFGWAGTTKSHPNDLQTTGDAVRRLQADGYRFMVVGGKSGVKQALRLPEVPSFVGPVGLESWARTMCQSLDVAMCPLAATAFNQSKSRLKAIESMAVGLPWIASPREEYRRVHRESGCGVLVDTPKQWYKAIKELMDNEPMRREHAEAGKEYMKDQTYEANAYRWMEAWEYALKIERG